jgi:hypothetical protein
MERSNGAIVICVTLALAGHSGTGSTESASLWALALMFSAP